MSYFLETEKLLKRNLKKKKGVNTALVVAFLIAGSLSVNLEARDLRVRNNIQVSSNQGPSMSLSENATDVINIVNPNHGISHNKYKEFNVGEGNNVIFNNSKETGTSVTGGKVDANPNLSDNANVILNEVQGNSSSSLNGGLEVFGKRADLVVANENGIQVNGAEFINTSGVTLSTGKVSVNEDKISLDTSGKNSSIQVGEKGLKADSDYLNFIAKTMEINGKINSAEKADSNINFIAGENKVSMDSKGSHIEKVGTATEEGIAISASHLGSMYGNNIRILSTKDGMGVRYEGAITGKGDVSVEAQGKVLNADVKGKNIRVASKKEIENTGNMVAEQNISLQAPLVKNLSSLEGVVRVTETPDGKKMIDRDRGIIYYDYHITVHNLAKLENELKLKKATIQAGNDLFINTDLENAAFENMSGDLSAGNNIKVKGNVSNKDVSQEFKLEDILSKIKVDLDWEHRSLVDNAYFNGGNVLKAGSLLDALHIMSEKKNKEFYDALKQIKDPTVTKLLNSYLGSDWKLRESIKEEKDWNTGASLQFYANTATQIKAKNILLEGKSVELGNSKVQNENIQIQGKDLSTQKASFEKAPKAQIEADNIIVKAGNFESDNTEMTAKNHFGIRSEKDIVLSGSGVKANTVLLEAGNGLHLQSQLGYTDAGVQELSRKAKIEAKDAVGIQAKNVKLEAADILTGAAGKIAVKADTLDVKDIKLLNTSYDAKMIEGTGVILKDHDYSKETKATVESLASVMKANKVLVDAKQNVNVEASLLSGVNGNSDILIQSLGDVSIKNSENINYSNYLSDSRGKNKNGVYKLVQIDKKNQEAYDVIGSKLKSEGNINIQSKNMDITSSNIEAKEKLELAAKENINILADLDKTKETLSNIQWGSGAIQSSKKSSEKESVSSSSLKAGDQLVLTAKKDINNTSSKMEGKDVAIKAGENVTNSAIANTEKTSEEKVAVGVGASGSVGFAGMGASGKASTLDHSTSSKVVGVEGLLAKDNEFKTPHIKAGVTADININSKNNDITKHENNSIEAKEGTVSIEAGKTTDLGNTDIKAAKDVDIKASEVVTNNKEDKSKEVEHKANIGVSADVNLSNDTVTKVGSLVNKATDLKAAIESKDSAEIASKVIETGKEVKAFVEGIPGIAKQDILGVKANETFAVDYDNTTKKVSETGSNSITAGGKANVTADNITLTNTSIKAEEANLVAKDNLHLAAGEKKNHEEKNGFHTGVTVTETVGVNVADGANAKIGIGVKGDYHGASDVKKESLNTTVEAGKVNKEAALVKEDDKEKSHYKDNRGLGIDVALKVGAATNTLATVDGTVGGNVKYSMDTGKETIKAETGEKESFHLQGGANASGSIDTTGKNPNFSIGTDTLEYAKNDKTILHLDGTKDLITKEKVEKIINTIKGPEADKNVEK